VNDKVFGEEGIKRSLRLPWLIGAAGLVFYFLTLNHWVSLQSFGVVTRTSGWTWQPQLTQPVSWLALCPFRLLPEAWIPLALNGFTAVCAALVLMLLARSIWLLPQDVPPLPLRAGEGRPALRSVFDEGEGDGAGPFSVSYGPPLIGPENIRPSRLADVASLANHAWLPLVLGVIVCGLQLTFWEHATSATAEMIDLLLFAFIIRCLLEFRIDPQDFWLSRAAFCYGIAMTNDWATIGYLPIFVLTILRLKGGAFFSRPFLLRMGLLGAAGLSLYLLLPAMASPSSHAHLDFWTALKFNLKAQKEMLASLRNPTFRALALASLVPILMLSIRWKSHTIQFNDDSRLGVFLMKATAHFVHALFFALSLWLALDPQFSPRHLGLGLPMLTYYYMSALVVGYCAGYFLVFAARERSEGQIRQSGGQSEEGDKIPWWAVVAAMYFLVGVMPVALLCRNLGQIRMTNGPAVRQFAAMLAEDLPDGNSVVLSDNPRQLLLLQAELAGRHQKKYPMLLDTRSLPSLYYQMFLAAKFPRRWPALLPQTDLTGAAKMTDLVSRLAISEPVVYLHPSSGLFFESFADRPNGSIHFLAPRAVENKAASRLSRLRDELALDGLLANRNDQRWSQRWTNWLALFSEQTKETPQYPRDWSGPLLRRLRLSAEQNVTASFLGTVYAKSLNDWGVRMQRIGRWAEAGIWFERALKLDPENLAARINVEFNERWQRGDKSRLDRVASRFQELFAKYGNWAGILNANGPVDEPSFLFEQASMFFGSRNYRQALRDFARCADLAPEWPAPKLWLALGFLDDGDFASALEMTSSIEAACPPADGPGLAQLLFCKTSAMRGLGDTNHAAECFSTFINTHRQQSETLRCAADVFEQNQRFKEELALVDELLARTPDDPELLTRKGSAEIRLSQFDSAITTLTKAIALAPSNDAARVRRAFARSRAGQFDAARTDYEELLKKPRTAQSATFGLGGIAWRTHDTQAMVQLYEQFLSNGVAQSPQYRLARKRLEEVSGN
jgi:tetratricopeptide (TPR) repeat protein